MQLSERSITALGKIITGDERLSPYRGGPKLVELFNEHGFNEIYGKGFPSRWMYAEGKLRSINGTVELAAVIRDVFDPREFMDTDFDLDKAIEFVNKRFAYDGYQVFIEQGHARVRDTEGSAIEINLPLDQSMNEAHAFIEEQIEKADRKILEGDYDGAITNARSLLEGTLLDLEKALDANAPEGHDGDLVKLYRRVQRLLNLEPSRPDIDGSLRQVLSGLVSIVGGLAAVRNRMGDAHARSYKPSKHHSVLAVNAAKTIANFLYDTTEYQAQRST